MRRTQFQTCPTLPMFDYDQCYSSHPSHQPYPEVTTSYGSRYPIVHVKECNNPDGTISRFATCQPSSKTSKETQTDITANGMSTCSEILGRCWLTGNILKQYFDIINSGPLKEKDGHIMDPLAVQLIKNMMCSDSYFKKHDFSSLKYLIIPISNAQFVDEQGGSHWSVLAFCKNSKTFYYFDSLNTHNLEDANTVMNKLIKVLDVDKNDPIKICKCPEQRFGYECGIHAIITVERLVKDVVLNKGISANCLEAVDLNEFYILKKRCLLAYVLQNKESISKEKIFSIMLEHAYKKERIGEHKRSTSKNTGIPEISAKGSKVNVPVSTKKTNKKTTANSSKHKKDSQHKKKVNDM